MATSGTVGTTVFTNQQIIDHAFRRCKMVEQEITAEHLQIALESLWLFCMTLVNKGIKLWNIEKLLLPLYEAEQTVALPVGTEDTLLINLRSATRITGTASSSEGVAENAFDGDLQTACVQTLTLGTITMELTSATQVLQYGILPNASGTWSYVIEVSNDGVSWLTTLSETDQPVVIGEWLWYNLEGVTAYSFYRLRAVGATILNVAELVYQNATQDIPLYQMNRDDYSNLPNKSFLGRPTQFWYDRKRSTPEIVLWPAPQFQFTFNQLTGFVQRKMQDVGTMTDQLEIPDRWQMAIVCSLAAEMAREIKEVKMELIPQLDADAERYLADAWTGETDSGPTFLRPNISPYTR